MLFELRTLDGRRGMVCPPCIQYIRRGLHRRQEEDEKRQRVQKWWEEIGLPAPLTPPRRDHSEVSDGEGRWGRGGGREGGGREGGGREGGERAERGRGGERARERERGRG